jgi:hypothetical protein
MPMLPLAFLLLVQAAAAEAPVFKAELKDVPAQGKTGPMVFCEGTTNLPDGALIDAHLYYDHIYEGRAIAKEVVTVKGGKFSMDFMPFPKSKKNMAGKYVVDLRFTKALQNQAFAGVADGRGRGEARIGTEDQARAEAAAIRAQLAGEVQAVVALGDQVKAKIQELKGKPADDWKPLLKEWVAKSNEIQVRADPTKVREYAVLHLDGIATSGLEGLAGTLNASAKCASAGLLEEAREGLTRLRQTGEYWIDDISAPRLTSPQELLKHIESARKLLKDALANPDGNPLPARRKFLEMNALLQKSLPEDYQPIVLEIGTLAADFFTALADKEPSARELHGKLDKSLEKIAVPLYPPK